MVVLVNESVDADVGRSDGSEHEVGRHNDGNDVDDDTAAGCLATIDGDDIDCDDGNRPTLGGGDASGIELE